jgi:hypothetical protein
MPRADAAKDERSSCGWYSLHFLLALARDATMRGVKFHVHTGHAATPHGRRPNLQNPMMNGGNSQSRQPQYTETTGLTT